MKNSERESAWSSRGLPPEVHCPRDEAEMRKVIKSQFAAPNDKSTYETMLCLIAHWPMLEESIRRFARIITKDRDQQDDLMQEAMIALWKCDVSRYDFLIEADVNYVRRILINHMWDVWGRDDGRFRAKAEALLAGEKPLS